MAQHDVDCPEMPSAHAGAGPLPLHDLKHDLSRRRLSVRKYDQYIDDADENVVVHAFWRRQRARETHAIEELEQLLLDDAAASNT